MSDLIGIMNAIKHQVSHVCDLVEGHQPAFAETFILPTYTKADEIDSRNSALHNNVSCSPSPNSLETLRTALQKSTVEGNESGRILRRWPGVLVYNSEMSELEKAIQSLNDCKQRFKQLVEATNSTSSNSIQMHRDAKWERVHDLFAMTVTLYVYRQVHIIRGPVKALYWSWLRPINPKKISKEFLIDALNKKLQSVGVDAQEIDRIGLAKHYLEISSSEYFYRRIQQPPRPVLTVHFQDGRRPRPVHGSVPIIMIGQSDLPFRYKPLSGFDSEKLQQKRKRSDATEYKHVYGDFYERLPI